jgi:hypothetical protein
VSGAAIVETLAVSLPTVKYVFVRIFKLDSTIAVQISSTVQRKTRQTNKVRYSIRFKLHRHRNAVAMVAPHDTAAELCQDFIGQSFNKTDVPGSSLFVFRRHYLRFRMHL